MIAGGDSALRKSAEFAEDDVKKGYNDLLQHSICEKDFLVGIAASGTTPYVIGAIADARKAGFFCVRFKYSGTYFLDFMYKK